MEPLTDDTTRHRWRLFLAVESGLLLVALAVTWTVVTVGCAKWMCYPIGFLWTWLFYTLPICVLYLIGHPPVITLAPLVPSAESRAFRRELKGRPVLSDDGFYAHFYQGTGIPRDITIRVRCSLMGIDWLAERLVPTDYVYLLDDELDLADVLDRLGQEFGVRFTRADYPALDGTLDNLVRLVHGRLRQSPL